MKYTVANFFIECLRKLKVSYLFGVPGRAIMPLYNAIYDKKFPQPILTSHETGAAFMAHSWAILTQRIGVCCSTTGPGATNLVTGVATAYAENVPLVVITGQTPLSQFGNRAYQESTGFARSVDTVSLFRPITKRSGLAVSAEHFTYLLSSWIAVAREGRQGPVHISVPWNIWDKNIHKDDFENMLSSTCTLPPILEPNQCEIEDVIKIIQRSNKNLLLLGRGVANAGKEALKFSEKWNIPFVTTVRGKGTVAYKAGQNLGHLGPSVHPETISWIKKRGIDTLLAVGTSLSPMSLGELPDHVSPPINIIQVNIDSEERGILWKATKFINCNAFIFFKKINAIDCKNVSNVEHPFEKHVAFEEVKLPDGLHPHTVMNVILKNLPPDTIYLPDSGNHWLWAMHNLKAKFANSIIPGRSLGAMGQATAGAIGAKLACPNNIVVALSGDGSFLMHGNEIATAINIGIHVIWIIFNNRALGRIYSAQINDFDSRVISTILPNINYSEYAKSFGLWSVRVDQYDQLPKAISQALLENRPCLIEVMISKEVHTP